MFQIFKYIKSSSSNILYIILKVYFSYTYLETIQVATIRPISGIFYRCVWKQNNSMYKCKSGRAISSLTLQPALKSFASREDAVWRHHSPLKPTRWLTICTCCLSAQLAHQEDFLNDWSRIQIDTGGVSNRRAHCYRPITYWPIPTVLWTSHILVLSPHAGSGVVRIDPLRFLAGCRTRRLNQALSVLSLSLGFFWCICVVLLY